MKVRSSLWIMVALGLSLGLGCQPAGAPKEAPEQEAAPEVEKPKAVAEGGLDRTVLPIVPPKYEPVTELDARKATAPPPFKVEAPEAAPNVVIVLIDDIGFGATDTFGGVIETPTLSRLAR